MNAENTEYTYEVELQPGEPLSLPTEAAGIVGPGHWRVSIRPADCDTPIRSHDAMLTSYAPEDEGLYDDYPRR